MSHSDIKDLSMTDLVELFKLQVNLFGVSKCINFLEFNGVDGSASDDQEDEKSDSNDDDADSVPESVDVLSESSNCDESNDDDQSSSYSSNNEDIFSKDEMSDDGSGHGVHVGA